MDQDNDTRAKRLNELWRVWGLEHGQDVKKAQKSALESLTALLQVSDGVAAVRGVQGLLADPETPGVGRCPLFQSLWQAVEEVWEGAGSGRQDVLQLQAMLLAAWQEDDERANKLATLLASPWDVTAGREGQRPAIERWRQRVSQSRGDEAERAQPDTRIVQTKAWQANINALSQLASVVEEQHPQIQQYANQNAYAYVGPSISNILALFGSVFGEHLPGLFQSIASALEGSRTEAQNRVRSERELLWWGQARYCHTQRKPFRRMSSQEQLWWAAWEAAELAAGVQGTRPPNSRPEAVCKGSRD